jgi:hypothetical protein
MPWSRVLLEKAIVLQLVFKFPTIGLYSKPDESSPDSPIPISLRSILILSSHICLGLASGFFLSYYLTKSLYAFLFSPMPCPYQPPSISLRMFLFTTTSSEVVNWIQLA